LHRATKYTIINHRQQKRNTQTTAIRSWSKQDA